VSQDGTRKPRRAYLPMVEALEALRLFSGAAATLPGVPVESGSFATGPIDPPDVSFANATADEAAWDAALGQTRLADLLATTEPADPESVAAGLAQLDRYLGRAWARAGLAPQKHADCTQAVYLTLLESLGRAGFDRLASEVGQLGIREVLSRETAEGPDFFRAIDMVKKRAQRERSPAPLDGDDVAAGRRADPDDWRSTLDEAIRRTLAPREAALIYATLEGHTPAEIAEQWGVAPKTVSNEKTRAFHKLREYLVSELSD